MNLYAAPLWFNCHKTAIIYILKLLTPWKIPSTCKKSNTEPVHKKESKQFKIIAQCNCCHSVVRLNHYTISLTHCTNSLKT